MVATDLPNSHCLDWGVRSAFLGLEDEGITSGELSGKLIVQHCWIYPVLGTFSEFSVSVFSPRHQDVKNIIFEPNETPSH